MTNGQYRTTHGSTVEVSGAHSGIYEIAFDWVEEDGACIECRPSVHDGCLVWDCDEHEGGSAELKRVNARGASIMQLTLDSRLSAALKADGLDAIELSSQSFVEAMRAEAKRISKERGWVSSDDLRVYASQHNLEPTHQNSWGAIFRGPCWQVVGRRKSAVPGNHAREIKVWQYVG
jgi:hypothetical protein